MTGDARQPSDAKVRKKLIRESLFEAAPNRFALTPTNDGYPDVDTYRDLEFYLEGRSRRANPDILRPIGYIDPRVNSLSFHTTQIGLVSHGLHCDCVSGSKFSADYHCHLTEAIRQEFGPNWNVVYLNACRCQTPMCYKGLK